MKVGEVGSLVWVLMKDGKWWPGRVLSLAEISASDHSNLASTSKVPITLLGRNNGSVEWQKLENSRRIKSFGCGDFDDFIKEAESSQVPVCTKRVNYALQEDAVLHALQLEKQEERTMLKIPVNCHQRAINRAKRSRFGHFPVESLNHVEHSVIHSQSMKFSPSTHAIDDYPLESVVAESTSSEARASDFSGGHIQDSKAIMLSTGSYRRQTRSMSARKESFSNSSESSQSAGVKKQKSGENSNIQKGSRGPMVIMNGENSVRSGKRICYMSDELMVNATCQEESRWYENKSGEQSPLEVSKLSHSSCEGSHLEDSENLSFDSLSTEHPHWMRTVLMDVEITVLANHRREDVPLVSLMTRLNGKAIIGHPIETEALDDTSDVFLVKMGKFHHRLKNEKNRMNQLVWRTYKRTPVCYISNLSASASKGEETEETCKISGGSSVMARKDSTSTEKAPCEPQIVAGFSKNEATKLQAIREKDGPQKRKGCVKQRTTCVPVNCILSNLLLAVGRE